MNKVQIYLIVMLAVSFILNMYMHGKTKEGVYDFRIFTISLIIAVPIYGRIFGWW